MIIIDDRDGSRDLIGYMDERAILGRLEFGDVMLSGNGPNDTTITVGVELKSISDLLSSISTGRLAGHQIPGLIRSYDHAWLLIFGATRPGPSNCLQIRKGKLWKTHYIGKRPTPWSFLEGFLLTAQALSGLRVKTVHDKEQAAKWLMVLDHWLEKPWEKHKGLQVFDQSGQPAFIPNSNETEELMARIASQLPAVGWQRGWAAAKHFDSVQDMIGAAPTEWVKVPGIGKVIAESAVRAIRRKK